MQRPEDRDPLLVPGHNMEGVSWVFWSYFLCRRCRELVVLNLFLSLPFKCCFEVLLPRKEISEVKGRRWPLEGRAAARRLTRHAAAHLTVSGSLLEVLGFSKTMSAEGASSQDKDSLRPKPSP